MSTMSPWVRPDAAASTSDATGSVVFDVPNELELGLFDDPADHTPLNLNLPNVGLGAVLKSFDDNLTRGCRLRLPAERLDMPDRTDIDIDIVARLPKGGDAETDVDPDEPDKRAVAHVIVEAKRQSNSKTWLLSKLRTVGIGALLLRDRAVEDDVGSGLDDEADLMDLPASLCRVKIGPMTPSGTYQRQFWVMVTGDEARGLVKLVDDDQLAAKPAGAVAASVSGLGKVPRIAEPTPSRPEELSAVGMIEHLEDVLKVPAETVLRAAGIKRRTYQHWKQTGAQPRLASQAHLWDLVLTVRGWQDELGPDLSAWIRRPDRLDLLEAGAFDQLTGQVLSGQARNIEPSERRYRDRMAAGYFEAVDRRLTESAPEQPAGAQADRPVRRGRRVRRGTPPGRSPH